jgi:drug/metabolite transporter (DMT)-like permease
MNDLTVDKPAGDRPAEAPGMSTAERKDLRRHREHVPRGILFMVVATMLFSCVSALAKWQIAIYPLGEVLFVRSISSFVACAAVMLPINGLSMFATRRPRDHMARGLSQSISQTFLVLAFGLMPLAGAIAINFSAPLFAALVSIIWLRERVGLVRWAALLIGFFGVLIVTNPGTDSLTLGALFALGNAIMYGSVTVAVRGMTRTESANTLVIWQLGTVAFFHSFLLLFGWRWPTPIDAMMLIGGGFINVIGQYLWTHALRLAPTSAVTPFYYLTLVWAMVIGFFVWGDVPSIGLLVGSAIVVASGLFLLWRETRRQRAAAIGPLVRAKAKVQ